MPLREVRISLRYFHEIYNNLIKFYKPTPNSVPNRAKSVEN